MDSNKRYIKNPSKKSRPNYTGKRIKALLAAGLIVFSAGSAIKKGFDIKDASAAQNELKQYELSLDNNVPGRAELGSIIVEFSKQNPDIEDDFMHYLDAQKDLFNKKELTASKEKVNSYKESIEQLDSDVNAVISKYQSSDEQVSKVANLDNPMSIIDKYNNILKDLDNYDKNMPTEIEALKLELYDELKSVRDKDSILNDIKSRYVKEYNANQNTKLYASNIKLAVRPQDYIIKTKSGKYITHGASPNKVLDYLGTQNVETLDGTDVYSIYNKDELLESVVKIGFKASSIYDGDNPQSINQSKTDKTLKQFIKVIDAGLTWQKSPNDTFAKQKYVDSLANFYNNKESKQVEENERD